MRQAAFFPLKETFTKPFTYAVEVGGYSNILCIGDSIGEMHKLTTYFSLYQKQIKLGNSGVQACCSIISYRQTYNN